MGEDRTDEARKKIASCTCMYSFPPFLSAFLAQKAFLIMVFLEHIPSFSILMLHYYLNDECWELPVLHPVKKILEYWRLCYIFRLGSDLRFRSTTFCMTNNEGYLYYITSGNYILGQCFSTFKTLLNFWRNLDTKNSANLRILTEPCKELAEPVRNPGWKTLISCLVLDSTPFELRLSCPTSSGESSHLLVDFKDTNLVIYVWILLIDGRIKSSDSIGST